MGDASELESKDADPPAPFLLKLLICFLLADAGRRAWELQGLGWNAFNGPVLVFILWVVTNLMLAALLILRTRAGRLWTQALLLVHVFYLAHTFAVTDPYLWLQIDLATRAKVFGAVVIDVLGVAYLATRQARAHLVQ